MMKIFYLVLLLVLISIAPATSYQESVGPWTVQFNCTQNLSFQAEHNPPQQDGTSIDALYLLDGAGHQVGWFAFFSYAMLMKAGEENFDNILNAYIRGFRKTNQSKCLYTINTILFFA